jgi:hypothetical protein
MAGRFMVAEIDGCAKCLESVFVITLDLMESGLELRGAFSDHLFEVLAVVFDLLL